MSVHHGKNGKVKLAANVVAEIQNYTYTETVSDADSTSMGDDWDTHLTGTKAWSGSLTCMYDPDDANGQEALVVGASVGIDFYPAGDDSGRKYRSGTATVMEVTTPVDRSGNVQRTFSFKGNGELTNETVA